ncbi:MAG: electron transport complex subunit RsxG [Woeseiaceae bacterium]|nr:electron transport complex subunit RsxG [Woeseiaceae bacterium]
MTGDGNKTGSVWSSALILAVLAATCTALVALTHRMTAERIKANEQAFLEQSLAPALGGLYYDSDLSKSAIEIEPPHGLPGDDPVTVYRVFNEGEPVAALFVVTARDGYSGPIRLLVGIEADGEISAVRVLEHRETPGLGDKIESSKSDWLEQFPGRSLADPPRDAWAIRRDGGTFDQLSGASITPRAVIKAIRTTLIYFEENRNAVFAQPASNDEDETS